MGKVPDACSRGVPASGLNVQYPRLGEGAPATPLSSSAAERCECSSCGRGRMAGGAGGAGWGGHRVGSVVSSIDAPGKRSAEENDSEQ